MGGSAIQLGEPALSNQGAHEPVKLRVEHVREAPHLRFVAAPDSGPNLTPQTYHSRRIIHGTARLEPASAGIPAKGRPFERSCLRVGKREPGELDAVRDGEDSAVGGRGL